jgi:hypothetical protein
MPPTRPLLIWALLAIVCAAVLTVEGILLLSGRARQLPGWRFGAILLTGNFFAVALAARLYDIHAEFIRTRCNCDPFQWTDPQLAAPLMLGSLLGSAVLVFTLYGSVRTLRLFRSPDTPVAERNVASEWQFSERLFVLALAADAGVWISANGLPRLAEFAYLIDPVRQGDGLGIVPLYEATASTFCGALLLIVPLTLMLSALYRSRRVTS